MFRLMARPIPSSPENLKRCFTGKHHGRLLDEFETKLMLLRCTSGKKWFWLCGDIENMHQCRCYLWLPRLITFQIIQQSLLWGLLCVFFFLSFPPLALFQHFISSGRNAARISVIPFWHWLKTNGFVLLLLKQTPNHFFIGEFPEL